MPRTPDGLLDSIPAISYDPVVSDMVAARMLRHARRMAGLTQRDLAAAAGVPQSTVARIELGRLTPRVDTMDRLLRATGRTIDSTKVLGVGIDRTQIRQLLRLTTGERVRLATADAAGLDMFDRIARP